MSLGYLHSLIDLILQKCLRAKDYMWYLDNGCSRHMTGDKSKLADLIYKKGGYVTYADNNKGKILGEGNIRNQDKIVIRNVLYVDGLKHNLLSMSQLCDKGLKVKFNHNLCLVSEQKIGKVMLCGKRSGNIYLIDLHESALSNIECLVSKCDDSWLWHRRASHINMEHLNHLVKHDLVIGIPKIKFQKDKLCAVC